MIDGRQAKIDQLRKRLRLLSLDEYLGLFDDMWDGVRPVAEHTLLPADYHIQNMARQCRVVNGRLN